MSLYDFTGILSDLHALNVMSPSGSTRKDCLTNLKTKLCRALQAVDTELTLL